MHSLMAHAPDKESALAAIAGIKNAALPKDFVGQTGQGAASVLPPTALSTKNSLNEILVFARYNKVSDVHICSKNPIIFRQFSILKPVTQDILTPERVQAMVKEAIAPALMAEFE